MKRFLRILRRTALVIVILSAVIIGTGYLYMQQPPFGKLPSGARLEMIKNNPRYSDGIFHNRIETPMYPEGESMLSVMKKFAFNKTEHLEPEEMLPAVKRDLTITPLTADPVITWFGHSTTLIQVDGKNILTDPHFSQRASPVSFAGPKAFPGSTGYIVADLPPIDVVVISHDHYDHLDYQSIIDLRSKTKMFFVPLGVGAHLEHWGIPLDKIMEVDWWTETELPDGLKIIATPSRHFSGRGLSFNKTSWGSYVIISGEHRVFFSGDSGFDTHFKTIGEKYGAFDIAMIETGQYNKLWPYIHMMPEQGVQAAIDLRAKKYLPIHWSKFAEALHSWTDPVERATRQAAISQVKIVTPLLGEATVVDDSSASGKWWEKIR